MLLTHGEYKLITHDCVHNQYEYYLLIIYTTLMILSLMSVDVDVSNFVETLVNIKHQKYLTTALYTVFTRVYCKFNITNKRSTAC